MNIILTGSLGHISKPLARQLLQTGHATTIISSKPQRKAAIEAMAAKPAIGPIEDTGFLTATFTGADAVYCMTPPDFNAPDQAAYYEQTAKAYAEAIRRSGVKRVIYLSSYGAHRPAGTGFITGSHRAEKVLNSVAGIALTHIRPTFFYYNLIGFISMIKAAGCMGAVYGGEDKLAMVSPTDIAAAIAEEITQPRNGSNIRYVTSDDRSCSEVAQVLGRAIGKPDLTWQVLPRERVFQSLQLAGIPRNAAENLVELGEAIHTGVLREDFDKQQPYYGRVSLETFAQEFAEAYSKQTKPHSL